MNEPMMIAGGCLASYLYGSVPFGYLFVRLLRGDDVRQFGSGSIGATNVARVMGTWAFFPVFVLDFSKGFLPVFFLPTFVAEGGAWGATMALVGIAFALAAIVGHLWPVFLRFRGGKGVATGAGVLAAIDPSVIGIVLGIWGVTMVLTRYVSLSSIVAAVALPLVHLALNGWAAEEHLIHAGFFTVITLIVVSAHRANIRRLLNGSESRVVWRKKS